MSSSKIQGELWSAAASDWAELQEPMHTPLFEAMLRAAQVGENTRLLDAGCGAGTASMLAAKKGAQISGVDAATALINIAVSHTPSGDFRVGDLEELPFDDNTFDVVFAANAVQYAANRVNAMQELKRVCRSGGVVAFSVWGQPEKVDYRFIFKAVVDTLPEPPVDDGPFGLSHPDRLRSLFDSVGMKVITHDEVNCPIIFPDINTFWRATRSGGPVISAIRKVGEEKVKQSVLSPVSHMITGDGGVKLERNHFQYLIAQVED